ncbi:MAG: F0F1 ATP synthase subunit B [Phycisphaerae bacterium]|nr:F0F1 ATP synthase subunit B [Phycisphaerae bacterium]
MQYPIKNLSITRLVILGVIVFGVANFAVAETPYVGDLGQAIASLVIFLILFVILGKYAWKPIVERIGRREDDIQSKIDDAEKRQATAEEMLQDYNERLNDIDARSDQMLQEARKIAAAETQRIMNDAHQQAAKVATVAQNDIANATNDAREELKRETANLAAQIATEVLQSNLTPEDHQRLIDDACSKIAERSDAP